MRTGRKARPGPYTEVLTPDSPTASVFSAPPPPPLGPARDPAWRGLDVALIVLFTGLALIAALILGIAGLALFNAAGGQHPLTGFSPLTSLSFLLTVQGAAYAAGFLFAYLWLTRLYGVRFWRAIHWTKIPWSLAGTLLLVGIFLSIALEWLSRFLPIPKELPIDRIFNSHSAWALTIFGVGVAPLFEEFIFRGLLYPSLRLSFAEGMSRQQARAWRPFLWAGAGATALMAGLVAMRDSILGHSLRGPDIAFIVAGALAMLTVPLLNGIAWIFRALSRWGHAEWLAIFTTGILFGLVHSAQLAGAFWPVLLISIVGIVLTAARAFSGSLVASWIIHCVYNGTIFIALFVATHGYQNFQHLAH